jgi:hypothetical protein
MRQPENEMLTQVGAGTPAAELFVHFDVINERIGLFRAGADSDKARAEAS